MIFKLRFFLSLVLISATFSACKVQYGFNSGSDPEGASTYSVTYFTNKAPLADPAYAITLSEELIDLLNAQTKLDFVSEDGDIRYEGYIQDYKITPVAVTSNETSAQERLTILVRLKYYDTINQDKNKELSVTQFRDYDPNVNFEDIEDGLVEEIIGDLVQDMYNKTLGDW